MGIVELMQLKSVAEKIKVSDDASAFTAVATALGVKDLSLVESVAKAIKKTARDPEQTVSDWFRDGGLGRLLAGKSGDADPSEDDTVLQCPHCAGVLILSGSA